MIPASLERFTQSTKGLDQGFVRLVDVMGDDGSVVTAARVTTGKGRSAHVYAPPSRSCTVCGCSLAILPGEAATHPYCVEGDRCLIRYMLKHAHWSPFEFAEVVLHLRAPMDVMRQLVRHWSLSFQEYSTRYSDAVDVIAATAPDAWRAQGSANRQGSSGAVEDWPKDYKIEGYALSGATGVLAPKGMGFHMDRDDPTPGNYLTAREVQFHALAREVYEERLAFGVAREQARKDLPLSNYTDVYVKGNLRDVLNMLAQRLDEHAQHEIRQYAQAIAEVVKAWVPLTWEAFVDYRLEARTFSRMEVELLTRMAAYVKDHEGALAEGEGRAYDPVCFWHAVIEDPTDKRETANQMTGREITDFLAALGLADS